ncbi:pilus assembly PilX N-terminal domain-containing protein [Porticoccaceae bacterium LTM1]|nr:pilus assembly PilX N-terminal domain-containing protein [Porticoccaceae bacterium LTM1]
MKNRQEGAVLIIAMIFLLLMALLATTVMQTSELEFKMAGNEQFREEAFQTAQAISTFVAVNEDTAYDLIANEGDRATPTVTATVSVPTGVTTTTWIELIDSEVDVLTRIRLAEDQALGGSSGDWELYEVGASYSGSAVKLGEAQVIQGLMRKVVESSQDNQAD